MTPAVSVVVPTNNRVGLLKETIASILSQTFQDLELIVVDNMSQDGTEEFMRGLQDPRVKYFRNPNHGIIAVNRNFGIRQAKGKYVAFCDDDDLWLPHKLEKQLGNFPEEGISCVSTNFIPIGDSLFFPKNLSFSPGEDFRDFSYEKILLLLNPVASSSVITLKKIIDEIGGFDENSSFRFIEDWELWLRLSRKSKIRILSEPLLMYRVYQKSGRDTREIALNTLRILGKQRELGYINSETFRKAQGNCFVFIGKTFLDCHDRKGVAFFRRGLIQSGGWRQKLRAILGILLFCLPMALKKGLLEFACSIRNNKLPL